MIVHKMTKAIMATKINNNNNKMKVISFKHPFLLFATLLELSKKNLVIFNCLLKKKFQPKNLKKTHFWL